MYRAKLHGTINIELSYSEWWSSCMNEDVASTMQSTVTSSMTTASSTPWRQCLLVRRRTPRSDRGQSALVVRGGQILRQGWETGQGNSPRSHITAEDCSNATLSGVVLPGATWTLICLVVSIYGGLRSPCISLETITCNRISSHTTRSLVDLLSLDPNLYLAQTWYYLLHGMHYASRHL